MNMPPLTCAAAAASNEQKGAFAEYVTPDYQMVWLIPESLSYEQASAISMCSMTAAQGVFFRLGLPCPFYETQALPVDESTTQVVFIYGATTSLGMYAAQMVNLASQKLGRKIRLLGAASASKHEMLRAAPYHYDALVDYREPGWTERVRQLTSGKGVDFGVDCISEGKTVEGVCSVLNINGKCAVFRGPDGGNYDLDKLAVKPIYGAVWEAFGTEVQYPSKACICSWKPEGCTG
jgi:NADPH:quinone reductase-like Zn-dependent oxidoreductase